ncbi:MAG: DNA translocase FtsK 4TM domain-containing protein [Flavobacteriales bacterium]
MARKKSVIKNRSKTADSKPTTATPKAKTKKAKVAKGPSAASKLMADSRTPKVLGVGLLATALFLIVACFSHLFTYAHDAVLLESGTSITDANSKVQFQNYLGKLGANAGSFFVRSGFGLAVFIPLGLMALSAVKILKPSFPALLKSLWAKGVFLTFWISIALSFPFLTEILQPNGEVVLEDANLLGGGIGFSLSLMLKNAMGKLGIALILLVTLAVFFIVSYDGLLDRLVAAFPALQRKNSSDEEADSDDSEHNPIRKRNEQIIGTLETEPVDTTDDVLNDILADDDLSDSESLPSENTELDDLISDISSDLDTTPQPEVITDEPEESELSTELTKEVTASSEKPADDGEEMDVEIAVEKEEAVLSEDQIDSKVQEFGEYDPKLDLSRFELPNIDLLVEHGSGQVQINKEELEINKNKIVETLNNYKIEISKIKATVGPTVTLYEIIPAPGVRISKIKNLEDDIALSLAALGIRIIAPIPGKGTIGIEVPNSDPQIVSMKKLIASDKFQNTKMELPVALGKTISNETLIADLAKMPHLLMAGATGQGKSVGLNAILVSLLYKKHPAQIKFVLVDPKKVELTLFNKIERHYLAMLPDEEEAIITDVTKVVKTLNSLCVEMDARYELLKNAMVRNIKEYNAKFIQRKLNPENGHKYMPYIVLVVDEFADLIMTAGKEVETPIARLAQLARAIGIHLIIATQRPSVNIITGTIKANFPARIAFRVTSKIDSRTILDAGGADQLIGRGDMLYSTGSELIRLQCGFVDTPEVDEICDFIGSQQGYPSAFMLPEFIDENASEVGNIAAEDRDAMFGEAARVIVMHQQGSTSLIQRKLKLGYNRAGRIIDQLEAAGIVGPFEGSKARKVLVPDEYSLEQLLGND